MAGFADGAIVGSAIIRIIDQYGREAAGPVGEYVKKMKEAVREA
jgi:tryptophan synthase alpha chain